jgi:hypothetical protein
MAMKLGLAIGHSGAHRDLPVSLEGGADAPQAEVALYVGRMGHRTKNFHNDIMVRRGFGDAAKRIQELYLAGQEDEAIATVADERVDLKSPVGQTARIRERYRTWGGQRCEFARRAIAPARGHRGDGQGGAAELRP